MNKYNIYFEIASKKMQIIIEASDKYQAENILREDILNIHKIQLIEGIEPTLEEVQNKQKNMFGDDPVDFLKNTFGMK